MFCEITNGTDMLTIKSREVGTKCGLERFYEPSQPEHLKRHTTGLVGFTMLLI